MLTCDDANERAVKLWKSQGMLTYNADTGGDFHWESHCCTLNSAKVQSLGDESKSPESAQFTCTDATTHQITNSEGNVCYEGPPEWVIPRFRRDLLIMAIIQKDAAVIEAFTAYRHECQEMLEVTRDPDDPQRIEDEYGMGFQDEWHTIAMKAALPELRAVLM